MSSSFNGNRGRADISDQDCRLEDLDFFRGNDVAVNFSARDQDSCLDVALDDRLFSNSEGPGGIEFAFESAVKPHISLHGQDALEDHVLSQECRLTRPSRLPWLTFPKGHDRILLIGGSCSRDS